MHDPIRQPAADDPDHTDRDDIAPHDGTPEDRINCPFCGLSQRGVTLSEGERSRCARCRSTIRECRHNSIDRTLALAVCGLVLFVPANVFPIMTFEVVGRSNDNWLVTGVQGLFGDGSHAVAMMVLATSLAIPFLRFLLLACVLLPIRLGLPQYCSTRLVNVVDQFERWAMLDIYLVAVVVSYAKLSNFGSVAFNSGWYPLLGIILISILIAFTYDPGAVREATRTSHPNATERGPRKSLSVTIALLATSAILFIPSYTYPVLAIVEYGKLNQDTVFGSVQEFTAGGQYLLAGLMFCASIIIPTLKIVTLSVLVLSVITRFKPMKSDRLMLYRIVEAIGRWSFLDLFVVSILIALAELGVFATVDPGTGLLLFAGVVISTMLAAITFDPRLFWANAEEPNHER